MSRGYRNNNPCNLTASSEHYWKGQYSLDGRFAKFTLLDYGYRAFFVLVRTYYTKYNIKDVPFFMAKYAPRTENATSVYSSFVVAMLGEYGLDSHISLTRSWLTHFALAITKFENGYIQNGSILSIQSALDMLGYED